MENLPKIGDHVFVDRSVFGIKLYEHHGIYVGDDMVVHYNGLARGIVLEKSCFEEILSNVVPLDKCNIAKVEMTSLEEFASGDTWQIKEHANAPFSGADIALCAKSRVGEAKIQPTHQQLRAFLQRVHIWRACEPAGAKRKAKLGGF